MRLARALLLVAALLGVAACADAKAATSARVTVSPGTVAPAGQVQVQGSCGDNSNAATVSSSAFGSVTVTPSAGQLLATVTVAPSTPAGTFDVRLTCASGAQATTKLTVMSTASAAPSVPGPDTGGGFLAGRGAPDTPAEDGRGGLPMAGWLAIGAGCLLAAAAVAVRLARRSGLAVRAGRARTGKASATVRAAHERPPHD
jgi:hypothetical protein